MRDSHQEAQWPAGELPGSRAEASTATSDEGRRHLLEDLQLHIKTHPPDSAHESQIDPAETSSGAAACTLASGLWVLGLDPVSYLG